MSNTIKLKTFVSNKQTREAAEMSVPEKDMLCMIYDEQEPMDFPLRDLKMSNGSVEQEYDIPEDRKAAVFSTLYIFDRQPKLDDLRFDLHEEKPFRVRDYRVIRCRNRNMLVSPYYPRSGGMVVDWMPLENENAMTMQVVR